MKCLILLAAFVALTYGADEPKLLAAPYGHFPFAYGAFPYAGHHGYAAAPHHGYALGYAGHHGYAAGAAAVLPEHNLAYAHLPNLAVPAPVPYGLAPGLDELVTKEKIIAPSRAITHITPQVTRYEPEFNVQEVPYDVPYPVEKIVRPIHEVKTIRHPVKVVEHAPVEHHTYTHNTVEHAPVVAHHGYVAAPHHGYGYKAVHH